MERAQLVAGGDDVLLLSMRRIAPLVAFCVDYEFEDVIAAVTGADRIDVRDLNALEWSRRIYRYSRFIAGRRVSRSSFAGPHQTVHLERDYELFFPVFNHAHELFALATIPGWRKRCRAAACFVSELWLHQSPDYLLELLAPFDHIFLGVQHPVAELQRLVGKPCSYLPLAADIVRFSPYPSPPERCIDVCNIGRRSEVTHAALLEVARQHDFFYYYDTVAASGIDLKQRTFRVDNASQHRRLLASLLQRSRFCFAHRGYINDPEFTKGRDEISSRVYECAAAGVVMLGTTPNSDAFRQQFDWADPVITVPFDCAQIADVLRELSADPERLQRIRLDNMRNTARRHDWVYRLRTVFETLGLKPTPGMRARETALQTLADSIPTLA